MEDLHYNKCSLDHIFNFKQKTPFVNVRFSISIGKFSVFNVNVQCLIELWLLLLVLVLEVCGFTFCVHMLYMYYLILL